MFPLENESDGVSFADTSTMLIHKDARHIASISAMMPFQLGPMCDQLLWKAIRLRNLRTAVSQQATLHFRTQYAVHYHALGEQAPEGTKDASSMTSAHNFWASLSNQERKYILGF